MRSKNMPINSKKLQKLNKLLEKENILDIILFGSAVKGKPNPNDIDIAIILNKDKKIKIEDKDFHISLLNLNDFFIKPKTLINTLLREGFSLRHKKKFSEVFNFKSKVMFIYELKGLPNTKKVKIVNLLKGRNNLVKKHKGEFLTNQVFIVDVSNEKLFEDLFQFHNIKYKKYYLLMH